MVRTRIPEQFITDLISRVDLVALIGQHVKLTRKSRQNFFGICPFHQEKTPSFSVCQNETEGRAFYYCFGCGRGGGAIDFLCDIEGLNYIEAIEKLANQLNIKIPREDSGISDAAAQRTELLYTILLKVAEFYQQQLNSHVLSGKVQNYLNNRSVPIDVQKRYQIGFAPNNNNLLAYLQNLNLCPPEELLPLLQAAGVLKQEYNKPYFRDRLIFPIRQRQGRIVGFGGRALASDGMPKYLNSPETEIFHKAQNLYGLYEARAAATQQQHIIVVEGYMDVVGLASAGINNAVAALGTAFTNDQLKLLQSLNQIDQIIFCFDGDAAGQKAAWRAVELCLRNYDQNKLYKFCILPEEEDPDSLVKSKEGLNKFKQLLSQARQLSEYFIYCLVSSNNIQYPEGKLKVIDTAKPLIESIPHVMFRDLLKRELNKAVGLSVTPDMSSYSLPPSTPQNYQRYARTNFKKPQSQPPPRTGLSVGLKSWLMLWKNPDLVEKFQNLDLSKLADLSKQDRDVALLCDLARCLMQDRGFMSYYELQNKLPGLYLTELSLQGLLGSEIVVLQEGLEQEFDACMAKLFGFARELSIKSLLMRSENGSITDGEKIQLRALLQEKSTNTH